MKSNFKIIIVFVVIVTAGTSCKKYLDVGQPHTQLSSTALFNSDATATATVLAIYAQTESQGLMFNLISNSGLSSDEFLLNTTAPVYMDVSNNNLTPDNPLTETHWNNYYQLIYQANAVLEGLSKSVAISDPVKNQLKGEAFVIRAFFHFYLLNLYGEIPIVRSTDYAINANLPRAPVNEVYNFIEEDLRQAASLLDDNYKNAAHATTVERVRPNRSVAHALLARVHLYSGNWPKAEEFSSLVINNTAFYDLPADLNEVFLKNSREQIWQIMPVLPGFNTFAGAMLVLTGPPASVYLNPLLVSQFSPDDKRRMAWIGSVVSGNDTYFFPNKFKQTYGAPSITEYTSILRLSEQYLIRAEAKAMQDNLLPAEQDLNIIRIRSGLLPLNGLGKIALIDSIQAERKLELFAESGDRWFNLKRLGKANNVLSVIKGSNWNTTDQLYPIPQNEMLRNAALTQNPGY